jgi:hypothetical protein
MRTHPDAVCGCTAWPTPSERGRGRIARRPSAPFLARWNQLGATGWTAVADALELVTGLTCLNGCGQYAAIRAGGLREMSLGSTGLGVWAARFLERSGSTLTLLDVRCAVRVRLDTG